MKMCVWTGGHRLEGVDGQKGNAAWAVDVDWRHEQMV